MNKSKAELPASPTPGPAPYKPYYPVVISLIKKVGAQNVLDAPCGDGWLGLAVKKELPTAVLDGVGLWEFPAPDGGYHSITEHDLDTPLSIQARYDAIVCGETIHLLSNPGVLLQSFSDALRSGGTVIITTPNTWYMRSRLQFFSRGFHSGFRPAIGKTRGENYITYVPFTFPLLHLFLTHYGFENITLHEVDEPKPKRWVEHVLALPSMLYCRRQMKKAKTQEEADYWRQTGSKQSIHGRWMVVSATKK